MFECYLFSLLDVSKCIQEKEKLVVFLVFIFFGGGGWCQ